MKVQEAMTRNVLTININASLDVAADVMSKNDVGAMPVEDDGKIKGMLTDRDIVTRAVAQRRDPIATRAGDIMTPEVYACYEHEDIKDVAKLMEDKQVRRAVVLSEDNNPVGMISISDIMIHGEKEVACEVLEHVSVPVHSMPREKQPRYGRSMW